jgi:hypothetical protein
MVMCFGAAPAAFEETREQVGAARPLLTLTVSAILGEPQVLDPVP